MAEAIIFCRPEVRVRVGGSFADSWARLTVSSAAGFLAAVLVVPRPDEIPLDSAVSVELDGGDGFHRIFTGVVEKVHPEMGRRRYFLETVAHRAMREMVDAAAWRKERSANITGEILDSRENPFETDLAAWPDVELARFSVPRCKRLWALRALEHAVGEAAGVRMGRVMGTDGVLRLGPLHEIRVASSAALESGVNVIKRSGDNFTCFALPVSCNQVVMVDEEKRLCTCARLTIQPGRYRAEMVLEAL